MKKIIWMTVLLIILMGVGGCNTVADSNESSAATEQIPTDPFEVVKEFFDAYTNNNETMMIALSTAEMQKKNQRCGFYCQEHVWLNIL